jgi:H+/Cl- antiporter ClcA
MIDPNAKLKPYLRLIGLVTLLGIVSSLVTFGFIVLVNRLTALIWEDVSLAIGMDARLFTFLVCALGGLLVGLLVKRFGDHNAIFADLMLEFGKTGRFNYHHAPGIVITAFVSLIAGASLGPEAPLADACGGIGTWASDRLKLDEQETRTLGYGGLSGMLAAFITNPFGGALLSLESAQGGMTGKTIYFWGLFPSLLASAVSTVVFVLLSGTFFETLYRFPAYTPRLIDMFLAAAEFDWGDGWSAVYVFPQGTATTFPAYEGACSPAWAARRPGHGDHRRTPAADIVLRRGRNKRIDDPCGGIGVVMLIVLAIAKLFATSLLLATGWKGGYIFPILFASVALGQAVGLLFPDIPVAVIVAATMAGALVAALKAPLFAALFTMFWCKKRPRR